MKNIFGRWLEKLNSKRVGGLQATVSLVMVYDNVTGKWEETRSLEEGRAHVTAANIRGIFYVLNIRKRLRHL